MSPFELLLILVSVGFPILLIVAFLQRTKKKP